MKIQQISITDLDVNCIVNAANSGLRHGSGVCGAIFRAAGADDLQDACDAIGGCPKEIAWSVALEACRDWLREHTDYEMSVSFAIPDERVLMIGENMIQTL